MDSSDGEGKKSFGSFKIKRQTSRKGSTKHKKKEQKTDKEIEPIPDETMEMLSPKQNGFVEGEEGDTDEEGGKQPASIKGMWKKALRTLKSNDPKPNKLSKKGSFTKRKDSESEEEPQETSKEVDPVYSLLKCAADLPKVQKTHKDGQSGSHLGYRTDGNDSTSKASSPTSSGTGIHQQHSMYSKQLSVESGSSVGGRDSRATSPGITNRDHMHHIVDESLGSEFRTFYKLTSPVKKQQWSEGLPKKHSPNTSFDHF